MRYGASVGRIPCGEKVSITGREGPWLEILTKDGLQRYVGSAEVSREKNWFAGVQLPAAKEFDPGACFLPKVRSDQPGKLPPRAIYSPDPEFDPSHDMEGTVTVSLVVGIDGFVHDVKVEKSLSSKLNQKAIEVAQRWKFDPAVEGGKAVSATVHVSFNYQRGH